MKKNLWFRFEQMSIYRKMYLIVGVSSAIFVLIFGVIFNIMVGDMKDSVVARQERILPLLCMDVENELTSVRELAMSMVPRGEIKAYGCCSIKTKRSLFDIRLAIQERHIRSRTVLQALAAVRFMLARIFRR